MQLSRSSVCQIHLATHGRTIHLARLGSKLNVSSGRELRTFLKGRESSVRDPERTLHPDWAEPFQPAFLSWRKGIFYWQLSKVLRQT